MPTELIQRRFAEHTQAIESAGAMSGDIERAATMLVECYRSGGKALFCGNGGSAADAQHLACELVGRFLKNRRGLPALALHANTSTLTAVGNDFGFEETFAREVEAFGTAGDVLVAISTSGNSANVVAAARKAEEMGLTVIAMTGQGGGVLAGIADVTLAVPCESTPRVQEVHILIGHILCEIVENEAGRE